METLPDDINFYINLIGNIPLLVWQTQRDSLLTLPIKYQSALKKYTEMQLWQHCAIATWLRFKLLNEMRLENILRNPDTDMDLFEHGEIPYYIAVLNLCQGLWLHEQTGVLRKDQGGFFQSPAHLWYAYFYSFFQLALMGYAQNCEAVANQEYDKDTITGDKGKALGCELTRYFINTIDTPRKIETRELSWSEIECEIDQGLLPSIMMGHGFEIAIRCENFDKTYWKPFIKAWRKKVNFNRKEKHVCSMSIDLDGSIRYSGKSKQVSKQRRRIS